MFGAKRPFLQQALWFPCALLCTLAAASCGDPTPEPDTVEIALGEEQLCADPVAGPDRFVDEAALRGLDSPQVLSEYPNGCLVVVPGGVVAQDLDLDGDIDLLLYRAEGFPRLFENDGTGHFSERGPDYDVLQTFGFQAAAHAAVDLDGDLLPEVVVVGGGFAVLSRNLGGMEFAPFEVIYEQTTSPRNCFNTLAFGDQDGDGDLDLVLPSLDLLTEGGANNNGGITNFLGAFDLLLLNQGNASFELAYELSPSGEPGLAFMAAFTDRDNDGDLDLLVTSDRSWGELPPSAFYRNDGLGSDGTPILVNDAPEIGADLRLSAMGLGSADLNGDGLLDYCMTDDYVYCLVSDPSGIYVESGLAMGLQPNLEAHPDYPGDEFMGGGDGPGPGNDGEFPPCCQDQSCPNVSVCGPEGIPGNPVSCGWVGWSMELLDFDYDGLLDIAAVAGPTPPFDPDSPWQDPCTFQPDSYWQGNPGGTFTERTLDIGFGDTRPHYGMSAADFDGDGSQDLILVPYEGAPRLYMNRCGAGAWTWIDLVGTDDNAEAYGAHISVVAGGQVRMGEVHNLRSVGQGPSALHFGLGEVDSIDELIVRWPDGDVTTAADLPINRTITVTHPARLLPAP